MALDANGVQHMTMGLLDEGERSGRAYLISTAVNCTALLLFVLFGVQRFVVHEEIRRTGTITYPVSLNVPPPAVAVPLMKTPPTKSVPSDLLKTATYQAPLPAIVSRLSTVPVAPVAAVPQPPIASPLPALAIPVPPPPAVKVGTFGMANVPKPAPSEVTRPAAAPVVGSFGASSPTTKSDAHVSAVASTGFGATAVVKAPAVHPSVTPAGFSNNVGEAARPNGISLQTVATSPTVTFVPHPIYTQDAKIKRIEGDVAVKVILLANGEVQVLGVVHSLDPGLDKEALSVAQKIRFNPATRNHTPIDYPTVVHIKFQLS